MHRRLWLAALGLLSAGCPRENTDIADRLGQYATVPLTIDLDRLSRRERLILAQLVEAAAQMDTLFWEQAYGHADSLLTSVRDPDLRRHMEINYGPWDRLRGDEPFLPGVGPKPPGANFYPRDMTKAEFDSVLAARPELAASFKSLYTLIRRRPDGSLHAVPYHQAHPERLLLAAASLRLGAALSREPEFSRYLVARADALRNDDYRPSDVAWLDMKHNMFDVVIGPIETYEDLLYGYKAAYEAYVLVKDQEWSQRLARYAALLPALQRDLPVPAAYKRERPGTDSELNAYDVIYYAGRANSGPKTIAINLPNDESIQLQKGTRRLQLKNAMQAKFDRILVPIADLLIAEDQREFISFDAFFNNTMFHEVAHGLGIKNTVNRRGTVREALKEHASAMEEGKADILGLFMVMKLRERGELTEGNPRADYVTFLASILRSVRFGASSAHGRANMVRFNVFQELGAFSRDSVSGTYRVNFDRMPEAVRGLAERLLTLQGDGDYDGAGRLLGEQGIIGPVLQSDLGRLAAARIPVDVVFQQGMGLIQPGARVEGR